MMFIGRSSCTCISSRLSLAVVPFQPCHGFFCAVGAAPWSILFSQGSKSAAPAWGWSLCCQTSVLASLGPTISDRTETLPLGRVSSISGSGFSAPSSQVWPTPLPSIGRTLKGITFQGVPTHLTNSRTHPRAALASWSRVSVQWPKSYKPAGPTLTQSLICPLQPPCESHELWQVRARSRSFHQHVLHRHPDHAVFLSRSHAFLRNSDDHRSEACGLLNVLILHDALAISRKDRDLWVCSLDSGCERCEDILDHLFPVNFHPEDLHISNCEFVGFSSSAKSTIFGAFAILVAPN